MAKVTYGRAKREGVFVVLRLRTILFAAVLAASLTTGGIARAAGGAHASGDETETLTAFLDGKAIPLEDVSRYYCDDFEYPIIRCSVSPLLASARATLTSLLTAVDYVTIYENAYYAGSFMNVTQDYGVLALIGWNDRISSFKARNSETGEFHTDWFFNGSTWGFCCNQQLPTLGGYDNTFSSVEQT